MDPLDQLIDMLRPRALVWKRVTGHGDWAWRFAPTDGVVFGRLSTGRCRLELPGIARWELEPGDYLLLSRPPAWILRGGEGNVAPTDFEDVFARSGTDDDGEEPGEAVRVVAGHFEFDTSNLDLLTGFLPPVVLVRAEAAGTRLNGVFALIDSESSSDRPGREAVVARLVEIVLIELMRSPDLLLEHRRGMLAGLADPQVAPALRAFHADIRRSWTVASLASQAHLSRSRFSDRFTTLLGQSPMAYVLRWRMAVARDDLRAGQRSIDEIAAAIGYGSASAFSTAFTRTVGQPPARFAREGT